MWASSGGRRPAAQGAPDSTIGREGRRPRQHSAVEWFHRGSDEVRSSPCMLRCGPTALPARLPWAYFPETMGCTVEVHLWSCHQSVIMEAVTLPRFIGLVSAVSSAGCGTASAGKDPGVWAWGSSGFGSLIDKPRWPCKAAARYHVGSR